MKRALSIDPGLKPGVVEWEQDGTGPWRIVRVSHKIDHAHVTTTHWDILATERQWYFGGEKDVNSILKLAFRAGFTLGAIPAARRIAVTPQEWRGGTTVNKEQMQRRILRDLTDADRALFRGIPAGSHGDILDAIGIGRYVLAHLSTHKNDVLLGK